MTLIFYSNGRLRILFLALTAVLFHSCLFRNNPCDPVNLTGNEPLDAYCRVLEELPDTIEYPDTINLPDTIDLPDTVTHPKPAAGDSVIPFLDSLILELSKIYKISLTEEASLAQQRKINGEDKERSGGMAKTNGIKSEKNLDIDNIATQNRLSCHTQKYRMDSLPKLTILEMTHQHQKHQKELERMSELAQEIVEFSLMEFEEERELIESKRNEFADSSHRLGYLLESVAKLDSEVILYFQYKEKWEDIRNSSVAAQNQAIDAFNDSIQSKYCGLPLDSYGVIKEALRFVSAGDTLRFSGGEILLGDKLEMRISGEPESPIVFMGDSINQTIFSSNSSDLFLISRAKHLAFYNISFVGSSQDGVRIEGFAGPIQFENCNFNNNANNGVFAAQVDLTLKNCRITGNKQGGIQVISGAKPSEKIFFENILVAKNGLFGISGISMEGRILRSTITQNTVYGLYLKIPKQLLTLDSSIIALNEGPEVSSDESRNARVRFENTNIFHDSTGANMIPPQGNAVWQWVGEFLWVDPLYQDSVDYIPNEPRLERVGYRPPN